MPTNGTTKARARKAAAWPRCVYCGCAVKTRSTKTPVTCAAHADLPKRDPHYTELPEVA